MHEFFSFKFSRSGMKRWLVASSLALGVGSAMSALAPSASAPDFALRTVGGPNLRLQELRGRVVMVNFWATWCAPCRQEMPELNKLYAKYRASGFVLLGVNIDNDAAHAADVAAKLGLKFPVLLDTDKAVSRMYELSTMPSTILIDRDGRVRYVHGGYVSGYEDVYDKQIRELLK